MPIIATNNFVFIIRDEAEKEKAGMFIPSKGVEKPHKGVIYSAGDLVQDKKIKNGKNKGVIFHKGNGFEIEFEGTTYLVIEGERIIAVT